jgi:hypothetical protein
MDDTWMFQCLQVVNGWCNAGRPMDKSWKNRTVYPPRYFAGFIVVKRKGKPFKVEFFNAPIIPISPYEARIYCGAPGSCFYEDACQEFEDLNNVEVLEIQYAISVYDAAKKGYTVERFNHPFKGDNNTKLYFEGDHLSIRTTNGDPVYGRYKVNRILDDVTNCEVPVTQFIS